MKNKKIALLVITCESFFSEATLILNKLNSFKIKKYFNCYLATKSISSINTFFNDSNWNGIEIPSNINFWGEEMQYCLDFIQEEYIFLWLDDFYPHKYFNLKNLDNLLKQALVYEPKIIRLNSIFNRRYAIKEMQKDIYFETKKHKYISSLVLPIFQKKFLKEIINCEDSPWFFENDSKRRYRFNKKEFIYLKSPNIKLVNLVVKGKILNSSLIKLSKNEEKFLRENSTHKTFNLVNEIFYLSKLLISRYLYYPFSYLKNN